jgi:hypothetical protein
MKITLKPWQKEIVFAIFFLFCIVQMMWSTIVVHEYVHYYDLRNNSVQGTDELCLITVYPENSSTKWYMEEAGYYQHEAINQTIDNEARYSEFKAYGVNIIMVLIFIFLAFYVYKHIVIEEIISVPKPTFQQDSTLTR